jgi:hypothetical protein
LWSPARIVDEAAVLPRDTRVVGHRVEFGGLIANQEGEKKRRFQPEKLESAGDKNVDHPIILAVCALS